MNYSTLSDAASSSWCVSVYSKQHSSPDFRHDNNKRLIYPLKGEIQRFLDLWFSSLHLAADNERRYHYYFKNASQVYNKTEKNFIIRSFVSQNLRKAMMIAQFKNMKSYIMTLFTRYLPKTLIVISSDGSWSGWNDE